MSEFEALDRLADTFLADEGRGLRVQGLADSVHLSQSAMSRVIARLEKEGLVTRSMCMSDRRAIYVHLTADGHHRHAQAKPTHRSVLSRLLC
ncbi:MarR family transcriptional regulator [Streptomyces sioyaensis]|uniref:MarR family transcriptional regulator n=1 Tax=Streptomyces sioyaensis TaxID=67364 RepID=UPI0037D6D336